MLSLYCTVVVNGCFNIAFPIAYSGAVLYVMGLSKTFYIVTRSFRVPPGSNFKLADLGQADSGPFRAALDLLDFILCAYGTQAVRPMQKRLDSVLACG